MQVRQIRLDASSVVLHKAEQRMVAMMIFKVSMFIICNSFHSLHFTLWSLKVYEGKKALSDTIWQTSHVLMTLNCSILLVTMSIFSKRYREMILDLSCTTQKKKIDGSLVDVRFVIPGKDTKMIS